MQEQLKQQFEVAAGNSARYRVLLVDDEPGIVEVLCMLLAESGYTINAANNGAQALELIRATAYDLILTDLCMPILDGEALYEKVSEFSPTLACRFFFITGDTVSGRSRAFLESTGNRWFGKPFNLNEIDKVVRHFLTGEPSGMTA